MYPHFYEHLAKQHMEELQREAAAMRRAYSVERATSDGDNTRARVLWYLLFGLHVPGYKRLGQELLLDRLQERLNAVLRMICIVSLALGLLIGSLLASRFGPIPATLLSGVAFLVVSVPVLVRSIGLLRGLRNLRP